MKVAPSCLDVGLQLLPFAVSFRQDSWELYCAAIVEAGYPQQLWDVAPVFCCHSSNFMHISDIKSKMLSCVLSVGFSGFHITSHNLSIYSLGSILQTKKCGVQLICKATHQPLDHFESLHGVLGPVAVYKICILLCRWQWNKRKSSSIEMCCSSYFQPLDGRQSLWKATNHWWTTALEAFGRRTWASCWSHWGPSISVRTL